MRNELEDILEETESKFSELNKKLDDVITNEQSKINSFKKKIKKSIIWLLIVLSLGCISAEAYKIKRKHDVLFENSRYYQVMEDETLESIAEKVCKESYSLDKIIKFNKKFDENFDAIAKKGEIIHFPKKYIRDTYQLNDFSQEIAELNKKIQKNRNIVEIAFNGNITKQKIDQVRGIINEINSDLSRIQDFKGDNYFRDYAKAFVDSGSNLISEIEARITFEIEKIGAEFELLNNILQTNNWNKPGTIEKLEELTLKNNKIRYLYDCFGNTAGIAGICKIEDTITNKKEDYIVLLEKVKREISKDKYIIDNLQRQVDSLLKLGLQNKELIIIRQLKEKTNEINTYSEWKGEKRLEEQIDEYISKVNKLNSAVNNKFNYAIGMINEELGKYEKEIESAEKLKRLEGADARLKYIVENPLAMIKYRYELLNYGAGATRANKLINKINSFIKI